MWRRYQVCHVHIPSGAYVRPSCTASRRAPAPETPPRDESRAAGVAWRADGRARDRRREGGGWCDESVHIMSRELIRQRWISLTCILGLTTPWFDHRPYVRSDPKA